uniref:Uncharacterized protein n=1 Tax=Neobodo designis TaxID=312471 RepID=A0A7S1W6I0_NEODS
MDDLRATVKDQAAAEKKLLEEIEQCYVANAATAAGHPAPQSAERSASAPAAETQRDEPVAARSGPPPVWPSFQEREKSQQGAGEPEPPKRPTSYGFEPEGPEAQALRISALWGCTPEDLLPADRKPAAPESPRPEINHLSPVPASSSSPPQVRRSLSPNSGPGAVASDTPDLDSGLSLLPPDLTHDVRELLSHAPRSASRSPAVVTDVSRSPGTRPADRSSSATATAGDGSSSSSSIAMRLLAADLDAFLTTDGADAQTRHALLLRVQELRERISSRRRQ